MAARLASGLVAAGLLRAAEAAGGNGAVLAKGDADAGALLLILASRGENQLLMERIIGGSGDYVWAPVKSGESPSAETVARFVAERKRFDPDIWALELDIPDVQQFIVESLAQT